MELVLFIIVVGGIYLCLSIGAGKKQGRRKNGEYDYKR